MSVIALVGDFGRPGFSCRTRYYGGIFINPEYENGHWLAETIIHEHLHLKLWLWWTFEPVAAQAALEVEIDSPVTGRRRQVGAMLQAYLIYAQCIEFYAWAVRDGGFGDNCMVQGPIERVDRTRAHFGGRPVKCPLQGKNGHEDDRRDQ